MAASSSYLGARLGRKVSGESAERNAKGGLRFAVAAPWCVEFEKDVILVVDDYIFVVVSDNDLDMSFLLFRDRLGFDAGLHLAINEVLDECAHIIVREFLALVKGKFLVLHGLLNCESGPLVHFQIQVTSVSTETFGVNGREAEGSLVLLCERLEGLRQFCAFLRGLGKDVGEGNTSLLRISRGNRKDSWWYIRPYSQRRSLGRPRRPRGWPRS